MNRIKNILVTLYLFGSLISCSNNRLPQLMEDVDYNFNNEYSLLEPNIVFENVIYIKDDNYQIYDDNFFTWTFWFGNEYDEKDDNLISAIEAKKVNVDKAKSSEGYAVNLSLDTNYFKGYGNNEGKICICFMPLSIYDNDTSRYNGEVHLYYIKDFEIVDDKIIFFDELI